MSQFTNTHQPIKIRPTRALSHIPCSHETQAYESQCPETPINRLMDSGTMEKPKTRSSLPIFAQANKINCLLREIQSHKYTIEQMKRKIASEELKSNEFLRAQQFLSKELDFYKQHFNQQQKAIKNLTETVQKLRIDKQNLNNECETLKQQVAKQKSELKQAAQNYGRIREIVKSKQDEIENYKWMMDHIRNQEKIIDNSPVLRPKSISAKQNSCSTENSDKKRSGSIPTKQDTLARESFSRENIFKLSRDNLYIFRENMPKQSTPKESLVLTRQNSQQNSIKLKSTMETQGSVVSKKMQQMNNLWTQGLRGYNDYVCKSKNRLKFVRQGCR